MQIILTTLWAVIGLYLTTGATFLQAYTFGGNSSSQPLNVTWQIGAVLLTGCVGGKNAGLFAQLMYLFLGLTDYGLFFQGGGVSYLRSPAFGYLLGFVPAGWLCGFLTFKSQKQSKVSLIKLTLICTLGLLVIHVIGFIYLGFLSIFLNFSQSPNLDPFSFQENLMQYSIQKLPAQFLVVCGASLISFVLRLLLLY